MAITAQGLAQAIISQIRQDFAGVQSSWPVAYYNYIDYIADYLLSNLEVIGTYSGVLPVGTPETAVLTLEVQVPLLSSSAAPATKAFVRSLQQAAPSDFVNAIITDAIGLINVSEPYQGVAVPTIYTVKSVDSSISQAKSMEECWQIIATAIVDSILTLTFTPITTTSPAGGTGTTILQSVT